MGSCEGSSRWRYCLREGRWPDRKWAIRTSSFLLFICFAPWDILHCLYTSSLLVYWWSVTNRLVNDLNRTKERNTKNCFCDNGGGFFRCLVGEIVAWNSRMARDSPDKGWRQNGVDELWMEKVRGWDEMRVLHKDLLSVQKSTVLNVWHWWVSRIVQIPWQLLVPHRSW